MTRLHSLLFTLTAASTASIALAADIIVTPPGSIQAAIVVAAPGDRILVQPGTYHEQLDFLGKAIEVIGVEGAARTILDASGVGPAVSLTSNEGQASVLRGLTITGGLGGVGPGGVVTNGTPTIDACVIELNFGRQGGGVHGDPFMTDCVVRNNRSSLNHGGGVWGAPTMVRCLVERNTVTSAGGGGVYLVGGQAVLEDCIIIDNCTVLAGGRGGGVYVASTATAQITRCVIAGNHASGGGFPTAGGGVYSASSSTHIDSCTIGGNTLSGSTVSGGGVYGPSTIRESIVWGNAAGQIEATSSVSYSDIGGGAAGIGNIQMDPSFWGAAHHDFQLQPGSPCIDSGDPTSALDPDGSRSDMGARVFDAAYAPPTTYCVASPNSVGSGAHISFTGGASLAANDMVLRAADLPTSTFGLFFVGGLPAFTAAGDGFVCIGGQLSRLPVVAIDAVGSASLFLDAPSITVGQVITQPGTHWNFQLWYRDTVGTGGSGFNFTDALDVTFSN